jgi:hypothetical protein
MSQRDIDRTTMVTAVVQASDGIRFVAAAQSADHVAEGLIEYIRRRCDDVLWPRAAARVWALIEAGELYSAIGEYFEHVGSRWDEERLQIHVVGHGYDLAWERFQPVQRAS